MADNTLPARLSNYRTGKGLSLRDAEKQSGVSFSTLARIERGEPTSDKTISRVENWLSGRPTFPADEMTLRDWFAGQALSGLCGALGRAPAKGRETQAQADARWSYERADAMLAARNQESV